MSKENLIDREELLQIAHNTCGREPTAVDNEFYDALQNFLKQTLQKELQKIAKDVIGEEVLLHIDEPRGDNIGVEENWGNGYNEKRKELITYFQSIGVEIK
jgi:hypothetical protein